MPLNFADRLNNVETSAIRELFKEPMPNYGQEPPGADASFRGSFLAMRRAAARARQLAQQKWHRPDRRAGRAGCPCLTAAKNQAVSQGHATAAQYLKAGRMPATLANVRQVYGERASVMGDALRRELGGSIEFVQPQGGLFVWARLTCAGGKVSNDNELAQRAIEQGVAFVPGAPFYATNPGLSTLRLSFATADVGKIEEGVGRLGKAI